MSAWGEGVKKKKTATTTARVQKRRETVTVRDGGRVRNTILYPSTVQHDWLTDRGVKMYLHKDNCGHRVAWANLSVLPGF